MANRKQEDCASFEHGILFMHTMMSGVAARDNLIAAEETGDALEAVGKLQYAKGALWGLWASGILDDETYEEAINALEVTDA